MSKDPEPDMVETLGVGCLLFAMISFLGLGLWLVIQASMMQ